MTSQWKEGNLEISPESFVAFHHEFRYEKIAEKTIQERRISNYGICVGACFGMPEGKMVSYAIKRFSALFPKFLTIKINGKMRRFDRASVIIKWS